MHRRIRARGAALLGIAASTLAASDVHVSSTIDPHNRFEHAVVLGESAAGRLGVVIPVYDGDVEKSFAALALWPTFCSPETLSSVDLILYKAEEESDDAAVLLTKLEDTAGKCFAGTKVVYANLKGEDNTYPKGPSLQFYKLFLDESVRQHVDEYDALAIIEWDVLVAHETSFQQLYHAAFDGTETFWVKGSVLSGTNFHSTAADSKFWHVLGHINGNAIYNNDDPDFVEFIEYTLARWEYHYPYDVALWATISDFPYSWPLWQRYSSKFVSTNLIANVGYENIDANALSTAVASDTMFIHGSSVEGGSRVITNKRQLPVIPRPEDVVSCEDSCGSPEDMPAGMSTVCDPSCDLGNRFDGYMCGAGDHEKYGSSCRVCYTDQALALTAEAKLLQTVSPTEVKHVVMCDTKRPPASANCDSKCALKTDTVCDSTCGTGRYGDYNCNWRDHGLTCRYCFHDLESALLSDQVAKKVGGRVVMCDTHEPPIPSDEKRPLETSLAASRRLSKSSKGGSGNKRDSREKNSRAAKTGGKSKQGAGGRKNRRNKRSDRNLEDNGTEAPTVVTTPAPTVGIALDATPIPTTGCTEECEVTRHHLGRVCDSTCSDNHIYGTRGCGVVDGAYGVNCRRCFVNLGWARSVDFSNSRVIMCDTMAPPDAYDSGRLSGVSRHLKSEHRGSKDKNDIKDKKTKQKRERRTRNKLKKNKRRNTEDKSDEWTTPAPSSVPTPSPTFDLSPDITEPILKCTETCLEDGARVCDHSCSEDNPIYGTSGCAVDDGIHGDDCRQCFDDLEVARLNDSLDSRVIMCETLAPPSVYSIRRLTDLGDDSEDEDSMDHFLKRDSSDSSHGEVCAFMASNAALLGRTEVTIKSISMFMPEMRVAIAVDPRDHDVFQTAFDSFPSVHVAATSNPEVSAILADKYCGDADLIFYTSPGALVSRSFTSKDTHSPRGELLVVYSDGRGADQATLASARETKAILGFEAPVFTYGTDLILPSFVNQELREVLVSDAEDNDVLEIVADAGKNIRAPEVLAAFAYKRNFKGMWFLNPQQWVTQHLFKAASIWDIPLVKPRFSCSIDRSFDSSEIELKSELVRQLDALSNGASCESGFLRIDV